jgi:hypothetical protein
MVQRTYDMAQLLNGSEQLGWHGSATCRLQWFRVHMTWLSKMLISSVTIFLRLNCVFFYFFYNETKVHKKEEENSCLR